MVFLVISSILWLSSILYVHAQYVHENLSVPSIGNRKLAISIHDHDNNQTRFLQFRFFDNNTNQTISHITAFVNITSNNYTLLAELFHTNSGNLILHIEPMRPNETTSTNIWGGNYASTRESVQYYASKHSWLVENATREPILGGFEPPNGSDFVNLNSYSFFEDNYTNYRIHINLYGIDADNKAFSRQTAPQFDGNINSSSDTSVTLFYNEQNTASPHLKNQDLLVSPIQQLRLGVQSQNVQCETGDELILKWQDDSPACVKPMTAKILIDRDWGHCPLRLGFVNCP